MSRQGEDKSVATVVEIDANRYKVLDISAWAKEDTMQSAGHIEQLWRRWHPDRIIIDADGLGAGVFDRLRERNLPVVAFHSASKTDRRDSTGELGFVNLRSYAWWNARTILDPANGYEVILPRDDELIGDLCSPKWWVVSGSRIRVESKDDIRKRLHRSPDRGDSFIYAISDVDASQYEAGFRVMTQQQVEQTLGHDNRKPVRSEEEQMQKLLWGGAHQNTDIFGEWL